MSTSIPGFLPELRLSTSECGSMSPKFVVDVNQIRKKKGRLLDAPFWFSHSSAVSVFVSFLLSNALAKVVSTQSGS